MSKAVRVRVSGVRMRKAMRMSEVRVRVSEVRGRMRKVVSESQIVRKSEESSESE